MRPPVDADLIRMLASFADLDIPEGDVELVAASLTNVLSDADRLARLDLSEVEPIVTLDPRWD